MLLGAQKSVKEWTFTLPSGLPFKELESQWIPKFSKGNCRVKTHWIEEFFISLKIYWNIDVWNGLAWPISTSETQVMAKRKAKSQIGSLTPDHQKPRIAPISSRAGGVWHIVGKILTFHNIVITIHPLTLWYESLFGLNHLILYTIYVKCIFIF
jgi:hypothetical protein